MALEIIGHSGIDGEERVIVESERLSADGTNAVFLCRYLSTGNDAGAGLYSAEVGGWTYVHDTVTNKIVVRFFDGHAMSDADAKERSDWHNGQRDGELWARATGTTEADIHMVPAVSGSAGYRSAYRSGVAKVRNERHKAEHPEIGQLVALIKAATNNVEKMTDAEMQQLGTTACFLTAAITSERERR